jgi:hypothetical protein
MHCMVAHKTEYVKNGRNWTQDCTANADTSLELTERGDGQFPQDPEPPALPANRRWQSVGDQRPGRCACRTRRETGEGPLPRPPPDLVPYPTPAAAAELAAVSVTILIT